MFSSLCKRDSRACVRTWVKPESLYPVRCSSDSCPATKLFLICSVKWIVGSTWPASSFHLPHWGSAVKEATQTHSIINAYGYWGWLRDERILLSNMWYYLYKCALINQETHAPCLNQVSDESSITHWMRLFFLWKQETHESKRCSHAFFFSSVSSSLCGWSQLHYIEQQASALKPWWALCSNRWARFWLDRLSRLQRISREDLALPPHDGLLDGVRVPLTDGRTTISWE